MEALQIALLESCKPLIPESMRIHILLLAKINEKEIRVHLHLQSAFQVNLTLQAQSLL